MKKNNLFNSKVIIQDRLNLLHWYNENKRSLPWRNTKNPYLIWISEVMLQQTTVTAVIPYYTKFINRFPTLKDLAQARIENIYEYWAGLGYYSRARNLHKAAEIIFNQHDGIFPKTYQELIQLPGFGPYTSRAVASLAYDQPVGVLDGNVIRILCRKHGLNISWWETTERNHLQKLSDLIADSKHTADINQAMMELGATICTPKKVMCLMCPWNKNCVSLKKDLITQIPLSKPKPKFEMWLWNFDVLFDKSKILLIENETTPFLKNNWLPLSTAEKIDQKPKKFDFKHGVTKYDIYVNINIILKSKKIIPKNSRWVDVDKISEINPTSLIKKIVECIK